MRMTVSGEWGPLRMKRFPSALSLTSENLMFSLVVLHAAGSLQIKTQLLTITQTNVFR
jgi:hypothetical protein